VASFDANAENASAAGLAKSLVVCRRPRLDSAPKGLIELSVRVWD
jgi:hypothetical protein